MAFDTFYTFLFSFFLLLIIKLLWSDMSKSKSQGEQYDDYADLVPIVYRPGSKWNIRDQTLHGNNPMIIEEFQMLNRLIEKTNALLKYAIDLINTGSVRNAAVIECVRLFCYKWKGQVQRMDYTKTNDAAITLDKTNIYMCLRDKDTGELHSDDSAMFVLIHEIAHMSTTEIGHTTDFWENMKYLLVMASEALDDDGRVVLPFQDFENNPVMYCGKQITGSPDTCVQKKRCAKPF